MRQETRGVGSRQSVPFIKCQLIVWPVLGGGFILELHGMYVSIAFPVAGLTIFDGAK